MSKIHLVIPDSHAHPDFNNDRAFLLGELINEIRPDVVVNIGDMYDMSSLSSYDKGKRNFVGRSYQKDIEAGRDFQDKMWFRLKKNKRKMPDTYFFEGNHEHRIEKALDASPELEGTIGFKDFDLDKYYNEVIRYEGGTPGVKEIDGVHYAHYFISGVMGRAVSGTKPAYAVSIANGKSSTCGHIHVADYSIRTLIDKQKVQCSVVGCFQDYRSPWAGGANDLWWSGVLVKWDVENGNYDPEFISMSRLKKLYGNDKGA